MKNLGEGSHDRLHGGLIGEQVKGSGSSVHELGRAAGEMGASPGVGKESVKEV